MSEAYHRLLLRQLKRHGVQPEDLPEAVQALLASISLAYDQADEDRLMVERSLDLNSQELLSSNAELRKSEERFRSMVQNSTDMIVIVNGQGQVTYASPSVAQIMGYEAGEVIGIEVLTLIHPDHVKEAAQSLWAVVNEPGMHPPKEMLVRHRDGSYRSIEMVAQNLLGVPAVDGVVYNARDVTERRRAEDALKESEERFRRLAEHSPVGVYELSPDHRPVYVNPALLRLLEAERVEDIGERSLESFFTRESIEAFRRHHSMRNPGPAATYEVELMGLAGTRRTVLVLGSASYEGSGSPLATLGTMTDITDRKLAEGALKATSERFKSLVQNASDLIMVVDTDGKFLYASPSMERLLGDGAGSLRGGKLTALLHPDDARGAQDFIGEATLRGTTAAPFEARLRHCDGSWRVFEFVGTDQRPNPSIGGFVLNARDVTERRELEHQLRHQAFHDPLTGLANRARLRDRLEHALGRASRLGQDVALIFMDLDDFKAVNDGFGHNVGDTALQHVAMRVADCLRPGDTAARLGGDEFAIVLEDSGSVDASRIAERIIEALTAPLEVADEGLAVRASMGITVSAVSGYDADDLLRNADIAMYAAKSAGKARYEVYRPAMRSLLLERFTLLRDLERAIEQGQLFVEYQPLIELDTREIVGFEALVRWNHPRLGRLPPSDFIGLAEESGLIVPLGNYVLEEACSQAQRWQLDYPAEPPRSMSVNVSVKQLLHSDFLQTVLRVLATTGLPPEALVLEVTESVMLDDTQSVIDLLHVIRRHGVRIAIDDFGTGYSSLSYLSRFPFDVLKIDKSFIDQTRVSEREGFLARAIIDIGKTFDVEVVAEGIEDVRELNQLKEFDCKIGQGFLFAMPSAPAVIDEMLRQAEGTQLAA